MLVDLDWKQEEYRGFANLPEEIRGAMLNDPWCWHSIALQTALPANLAFKLKLDMLDEAGNCSKLQASDLPIEMQNLLAGEAAARAGRHRDACSLFSKAISPQRFLAPALRHLGLARWRCGSTMVGVDILTLYLAVPDGTAIDPKAVAAPATPLTIASLHDCQFAIDGKGYVALTSHNSAPAPTSEALPRWWHIIRQLRNVTLALLPIPAGSALYDVVVRSAIFQFLIRYIASPPPVPPPPISSSSFEALLSRQWRSLPLSLRLDRPQHAIEKLKDAVRDHAGCDTLEYIVDTTRFAGIAGALTARMLVDLDWKQEEYQGFANLPEEIRGAMLNDPWYWHSIALQTALPANLAFKLRLDILDEAGSRGKLQASDLPIEMQNLLAGDAAARAGHHSDACSLFSKAIGPQRFLAPALRKLGLARWRCGSTMLGTDLLTLYLAVPDGTAIDPKAVATPATPLTIASLHDCKFAIDGTRYMALTSHNSAPAPTSEALPRWWHIVRQLRKITLALLPISAGSALYDVVVRSTIFQSLIRQIAAPSAAPPPAISGSSLEKLLSRVRSQR
jgi:hypothetical protein